MNRRRTVAGFVAAAVCASVTPGASSHPNAPAATFRYRIVAATHVSSSKKLDPPFYSGSSSSTWRLGPATPSASNVLEVTISGPVVVGLARVNVRGVFQAQATSNHPARCSLVARTGSTKYPAVAPAAFPLAVSSDPKSSARVLVSQGPGRNVHATLGNPYFSSECSTRISGEPPAERTMLLSLPKSTFGKSVLVLRYVGTTSRDRIQYRWNTTFTLKRLPG